MFFFDDDYDEDNDIIHYYHYDGYFTTPPCTEGVKWICLSKIYKISQAQIDYFYSIIHYNFRPVQPINDRIMYYY
ncbi:MAG: carbonic anhydrase family protein [Candidatus Lokiarchaeota archaeon]|nr:carbonic anhydrase family protein [Candidatus Lokiarchaeota archaeon]